MDLSLLTSPLLENGQFSAGRNRHRRNFVPRKLRQGIEMPQRFQFVAEKLEPDGPGAGERKDIQDSTPQGEVAFLRHLRFRFVTLILKPFDQIERIDPVTASEPPRPLANGPRRK